MSLARKKATAVKKLLAAADLLWSMVDGEWRAEHPFTNTFIGTRAADLEDIAKRLDPALYSQHIAAKAKG